MDIFKTKYFSPDKVSFTLYLNSEEYYGVMETLFDNDYLELYTFFYTANFLMLGTFRLQ